LLKRTRRESRGERGGIYQKTEKELNKEVADKNPRSGLGGVRKKITLSKKTD